MVHRASGDQQIGLFGLGLEAGTSRKAVEIRAGTEQGCKKKNSMEAAGRAVSRGQRLLQPTQLCRSSELVRITFSERSEGHGGRPDRVASSAARRSRSRVDRRGHPSPGAAVVIGVGE